MIRVPLSSPMLKIVSIAFLAMIAISAIFIHELEMKTDESKKICDAQDHPHRRPEDEEPIASNLDEDCDQQCELSMDT